MNDQNKEFIKQNLSSNIVELMLKSPKGIDLKYVVTQINSRQKAKSKLPSFYSNFDLTFPESVQIEQTSSESTAKYKSHLLAGEQMADLTGGWGVDTFYFAQCFKHCFHIEIDETLSQITQCNFQIMNINNVEFVNCEACEFLVTCGNLDLIFIDPARRSHFGQKVYFLEDLTPDIITLMPLIMRKTDKLMIKLSPMLDIKSAESKLNFIKEIHIVSVNNECKELLIIVEKDYDGPITYHAVNIVNEILEIHIFPEHSAIMKFSEPKKYLYEPNSSLMKLGFWSAYSEKWGINQIAPNTHILTSEKFIENFPGRVFEIISEIKANKKDILFLLPNKKANVAVRNYPLSAEELKKKLGVSDGGEKFIWGLRNADGKALVFLTERKK